MPAINGIPDAMSDVLALVRMHGEMICATQFSDPWSVSCRQPLAHFHIVERGQAWLVLDDEPEPVRLNAGDLVILPLGVGHVLQSSLGLPSQPVMTALAEQATRRGPVYHYGGGGEATEIACGQFSFRGVLAPRLLALLPKLIHVEPSPGRPLEWLRLTSHFLVHEVHNPTPGSAIMLGRLLDLLFVQAIREWGAKRPGEIAWLSGLIDPQIGRALSALHAEPARPWTVGSLADKAGLSRSAFAARFMVVVGQTPLRYLTTWRLNLAADYLRSDTMRIGEIARLVGYGSEAAFTRAFKAQFAAAPAAFRRDDAG